MDYLSIWYLLLGFFFSNGMPHFLFGVAGKRFRSPLGANSSAQVNVVWGLINFIAGSAILWRRVSMESPNMVDAMNFLAAYWLVVAMFGFFMDHFRGEDV